MATQTLVLQRRHRISELLAKSVTKPQAICKKLDLPMATVKNDLKWMRKNSRIWLSGHALNGYVFETQQTIEQLRDIEEELQEMRKNESQPLIKLRIISELKEVINMRWVIEGEGPTLMQARIVAEKAEGLGGK